MPLFDECTVDGIVGLFREQARTSVWGSGHRLSLLDHFNRKYLEKWMAILAGVLPIPGPSNFELPLMMVKNSLGELDDWFNLDWLQRHGGQHILRLLWVYEQYAGGKRRHAPKMEGYCSEGTVKWFLERFGIDHEGEAFKGAKAAAAGVYRVLCESLDGDGPKGAVAGGPGGTRSRKVFVAMWFNKETDACWSDGIEIAVRKDCDFKPKRIDKKEFNEKICEEIITEIRQSRFVVADCTGSRNGVYFEAGFAKGLGLPVIWTCRKSDKKKLPFNTRQYNYIFWKTPEELREKLALRIKATIQSEHGAEPFRGNV